MKSSLQIQDVNLKCFCKSTLCQLLFSSYTRTGIRLKFVFQMRGALAGVRARRLLYLALVKTHLDYASEAWSGQSLNITSAIERVQRRATNYILGIPSRSVPYKERLSRTNLLPLTYWHEIKDLLFIHGCLNGKYNINIERFVKFAPDTNRRSWCHNNFVIPRSRTKHFQQSFFVRSCRLWNSLPKELKLVNSTTDFK